MWAFLGHHLTNQRRHHVKNNSAKLDRFVFRYFHYASLSAGQAVLWARYHARQCKEDPAAGLAEAQKNNWNVVIAIVDNHGALVYYERMDDTQSASPVIAIEKARSAAMFRRPTRAMEDTVNKGRAAFLGMPLATPITGGLPIVIGGKIAGAIGVSGVTSDQDEQVAKAGLEGLK